MVCPRCGYKNNDVSFCKKCGTPLKKELKNTENKSQRNKAFIVISLVMLAVTGLTVGMLLQSSNVAAQTNNNPTVTANMPQITSTWPKLIDSGSTRGYDTYAYGPFRYEWQVYAYNDQHILIRGTLYLQNEGKTIKQTQDIKKFSDETVVILAIPKWTGTSNYQTVTTNFGYSTVTDYYWHVLRPRLMNRGPYGL